MESFSILPLKLYTMIQKIAYGHGMVYNGISVLAK